MLKRLYQLMDRGEWVQLKREAEVMLSLPNLDDYSLGRIYRALGRACYGLSDYERARSIWEAGLPYALRAGDWDSVGLMEHNIAVSHMILGNDEAAEAGFEKFLLGLDKYHEARKLEGHTHYNLGLFYRQRRDYDSALAAYMQALHCYLQQGDDKSAGHTHQNMAWLLLLLRRVEEARVQITRAAGFLSRLSDDYHREQLILLGYFHLVLGDYAGSLGYLEPLLDEGAKVSRRHRATAKWALAELYAEQGHLDLARRSLREALCLAMEAKEMHLVSLCGETEAKIRGKTDIA